MSISQLISEARTALDDPAGLVDDYLESFESGSIEEADAAKAIAIDKLDTVLSELEKIENRLKADLAYHGEESARITREYLDVDAPEGYSAEQDAAESYHSGRENAISDVLHILAGDEVKLYSETEAEVFEV